MDLLTVNGIIVTACLLALVSSIAHDAGNTECWCTIPTGSNCYGILLVGISMGLL